MRLSSAVLLLVAVRSLDEAELLASCGISLMVDLMPVSELLRVVAPLPVRVPRSLRLLPVLPLLLRFT